VTLLRGHLREEPYAGEPPLRICEGEVEWLSYSTTLCETSGWEKPYSGGLRAGFNC